MSEKTPRETPQLGIFWVVQTTDGEAARRRSAGCPLDQAEPYGDCLTFGPGHYETWDHWRRDRTVAPAVRAIVRSFEYEDWPRGRIVFDRSRDLFVLYATVFERLKEDFRPEGGGPDIFVRDPLIPSEWTPASRSSKRITASMATRGKRS